MGGVIVLVGSIAIAFLLAYMLFKLGDREGKEHFLLQLLLLFMIMGCVLIAGKAVSDETDYCAWNMMNSTINSNVTSYSWEYECSDNTNNTNLTFFNLTLWFVRLLALYIMVYFIYSVFKYARKQVP